MSDKLINQPACHEPRPVTAPLAPVSPEQTPKLSEALAIACDRCKTVARDGEVSAGRINFKYPRADDVIACAKEAMNGTGLTSLIPLYQETVVISSGQHSIFTMNRVMRLSHSSGEFIDIELRGWPIIPEGGMSLQKTLLAAMTITLAAMYRTLLQMPASDGNDEMVQQFHGENAQGNSNSHEQGGMEGNARTPAASQMVPAPQAAQATTPPSNALLNKEQGSMLVELIQQYERSPEEVDRALSSVGVVGLGRLPARLAPWLEQILIHGQIKLDQIDRISHLVQNRQPPLAWETVNRRLLEKYGVQRLAMLTVQQGLEIEQALSPKQQAQTA